jgi:hypothetical protein
MRVALGPRPLSVVLMMKWLPPVIAETLSCSLPLARLASNRAHE